MLYGLRHSLETELQIDGLLKRNREETCIQSFVPPSDKRLSTCMESSGKLSCNRMQAVISGEMGVLKGSKLAALCQELSGLRREFRAENFSEAAL